MADASNLQDSFLGGEWSPLYQGRATDPEYKRSMNKCRNGLPIEEGAATRRPGFRLISAMRKGAQGVYRAFDFAQSSPYLLELTASHLRFVAGSNLVTENTTHVVDNISTANPAVFETADAHGYTTGDEVLCLYNSDGDPSTNYTLAPVLGRELEVTVIDSTHFSVADAVTGATIDGSTIVLGMSTLTCARIFDLATSYLASELDAIRTVQDQSNLLLLHGSHQPLWINNTAPPNGGNFAIFTVTNPTFRDGPYLDPVSDGTTVTLSGTSGSVTATLSGGSVRWTPTTDVGRLVRFFSEPAAWAVGTAYSVGNQVKYNGAYYQALKANTGKQPDVDVINWGVATGAAVWNWGTITAVASATVATVSLNVVTNPDGTQGTNLTGTAIASGNWRLGVYSNTTGWPTCGVYHEGRLWLGGAVGNRIDGGVSNGLPTANNGNVFDFTPTAFDGTVADNNAIAAVFNSQEVNKINWLISDGQGIIAGTQHGEWMIRASANNDALTPTSIQAREQTTYGSAAIQSRRASLPIVFVQRYGKKVFEYITTDFRGLAGRNISVKGKHLLTSGVKELAYQREKYPVLWARLGDGSLAGCTFKRESPWASDPPDFSGWHKHSLPGLTVTSIQVGPSFDGSLDALSIVAKRASDGKYYGLQLTDFFDVDWNINDALFVDMAETPVQTQFIAGTPNVVRFLGLWRLAGQTVSAFIAGVDAGDFLVNADGHFDVQLDQPNSLLTTALVTGGFTSGQGSFNGLALSIQTQLPTVAAAPASGGILEFDTSLGGDGNGNAFADWDNPNGARLFTSSAASGACALWDLTATDTPPTRLAFHATNAVQGLSAIAMDRNGVFYLGAFSSLVRLAADLQSNSTASYASLTMATPNQWFVVPIGATDYLVSIGGAEVDVLNVSNNPPTFVGKNSTTITEAVAGVHGRIKAGSKSAQVWVIGQPTTSGGAFTRPGQPLGLYRATITPGAVTPVTMRRQLSITAAMFGWTHISGNVDLLGDETDGNPIVWAQSSVLPAYNAGTTYNQFDCVFDASTGHDYESKVGANTGNAPAIGGTTFWNDLGVHQAVSEQNFIKINANTGAVMWTVKMVAGLAGYRHVSRVRFGHLRVLDVSAYSAQLHHLWDISTLTGAGVNTPVDQNNVSPSFAKQFYNDKTGQWIAGVSYAQLGNPAPVGHSATNFNTWAQLGPTVWTYPLIAAPNAATFVSAPAAIGYTYESDFQILRALLPQEAGAQNGPALGKSRRTHMYAALFQQAQGVKFGTDNAFLDANMHATAFKSAGNNAYAKNQLFSGVAWEPIEGVSDFDSMICWKITRPYPCTVCSVEGFLHTQDR